MTHLTELHTLRLRLRAWRPEDRESFATLNADPTVMEHFPEPLSHSQSDLLADRIEEHLQKEGWGLWAVEVARTQAFAGFVGLNRPAFQARFTPAVEVGWRLPRQYWGNGYATEAAEAALAYGFQSRGLAEIVSFTSTGNLRSQRVMEKLGMRRNPEDDFDHPGLPRDHRLCRHVLYRLTRSDWTAPRDREGAPAAPFSPEPREGPTP